MPKVNYADLESITKFLDKIAKILVFEKHNTEAIKLSKMIKDKYTEIKPHYHNEKLVKE